MTSHFVAGFVISVLLGLTSAPASPDPGNCDRTGDAEITTADALIALFDAVHICKSDHACDSNGDFEMTVTDALLLLRMAVGLPTEPQCSCIYFEECFNDDDCLESNPPGFYCAGVLCVQCEGDEDCNTGEVCDPCSRECVAE